MRVLNILASISCLMIRADVTTDTEVSQVIDIVTRLRIVKKHLIITTPKLNDTFLKNKTINFNVVIYQKGAGNTESANNLNLDIVLYMPDGNNATTSLCPVLGKTHAQTYNGLCPDHFQKPHGKELKISFIGTGPYINYNPIGGSEFLLVKILAEKFKFTPKFIAERSYDIIEQNGTFYGMLHRVRFRNEH